MPGTPPENALSHVQHAMLTFDEEVRSTREVYVDEGMPNSDVVQAKRGQPPGQGDISAQIKALLDQRRGETERIYQCGFDVFQHLAEQMEDDVSIARQAVVDAIKHHALDLADVKSKADLGRTMLGLEIAAMKDDERKADLAEAKLKAQRGHVSELTAQLAQAEHELGLLGVELENAVATQAELSALRAKEREGVITACEAKEMSVVHLRDMTRVILGQRKDVGILTKRALKLEEQYLATQVHFSTRAEVEVTAAPAQPRKQRNVRVAATRKSRAQT